MVTGPLAAVTVTGKLSAGEAGALALPDPDADADADAAPAVDDVLAPAADVVLEDDEQPARAAVQAAAVHGPP